MKKKIVIAGGTGFIGSFLAKKYHALDYEVMIISRQANHLSWNDRGQITNALERADLLINLAGKSVNCRYHRRNKEEIITSRTDTTAILGEALSACDNPPPLWINSSTATIYRQADDRPMTEASGDIGSGFSVDVAKAWENAFFSFELPNTRQAALRIAIALGGHGGVMTPYRNLVKFGLGGVQGTGNQKFSWIHVEDLFRIIRFLQEREDLSGIFNCSAPNPVTNRELMQKLRTIMNVRAGLPAAGWMLEIGAVLLRTETELILKSRWVIPERLEREGFTFVYEHLDTALQDLIV
ncbi:TIGR01777 family oxidoreductase [Paenibacillus harenae]|uniref:TIGR01777 family oxidoreductase n=1 Tax=Paenibacillus harenae TaxID=306543 RepID=UPI0003FAFD66|nr:TIGR01777 family oxidoreductase [Paenibacillus harenae]